MGSSICQLPPSPTHNREQIVAVNENTDPSLIRATSATENIHSSLIQATSATKNIQSSLIQVTSATKYNHSSSIQATSTTKDSHSSSIEPTVVTENSSSSSTQPADEPENNHSPVDLNSSRSRQEAIQTLLDRLKAIMRYHDQQATRENAPTCQTGKTWVQFDFDVPTELCSRFVGKNGRKIKRIFKKTGATVILVTNFVKKEFQVCQVVGSKDEVDKALALIRQWFPLKHYPNFTMEPVDMYKPIVLQLEPVLSAGFLQMSLPRGVTLDVYVSAVVDAGHVFVQQPSHPIYITLLDLNELLQLEYGQEPDIPCLPRPVKAKVMCVCEKNGHWYRAMVITPENQYGDVYVKFVDYGGYAVKPVKCLKKVRHDITFVPLHAVECRMANIVPNQNEQFFSQAANEALAQMCLGKMLQCQVVQEVDDTPSIYLYAVDWTNKSATLINKALADTQLVQWI